MRKKGGGRGKAMEVCRKKRHFLTRRRENSIAGFHCREEEEVASAYRQGGGRKAGSRHDF